MTSQRILVVGATGGTGRHVVEQAVAAGHEVSVLVRNPDRLPTVSRPLRIHTADLLLEPRALGPAVTGQDAVICTLGVGGSFKSRGLISHCAPSLVNAMHEHGVRRLVFMSAFGVGDTWRDTPIVPRLFIATLLRGIYADKEAGEAAIRRSDLDWTIVYSAGLTNGPKTGSYRVGERLDLSGFPHISRADAADFLVRQVDDRVHLRKGVLVAS